MKIAVCIKQTPSTTADIRIASDGSALELDGVELILSTYDEFALEQALQVRDQLEGAEVVAITVGNEDSKKVLQQAYALGVDESVLIQADALDAAGAATCVSAYLQSLDPILVFCGRQALDDDQWEFPSALAEKLAYPHITAATTFELAADGSSVTCQRHGDGVEEVLEAQLPAVISCEKGLNDPRVPTLKGRLNAKKKKIEIKTPADVGVSDEDLKPALQFVSYAPPPEKSAGKILTSAPAEAAAELVQLLREEAKVI